MRDFDVNRHGSGRGRGMKSKRHRGGKPEITPRGHALLSFSPFFFTVAPAITARCPLRNVAVSKFRMTNEIVDRVSRRNFIVDAIVRVKMENICQMNIVRERYQEKSEKNNIRINAN